MAILSSVQRNTLVNVNKSARDAGSKLQCSNARHKLQVALNKKKRGKKKEKKNQVYIVYSTATVDFAINIGCTINRGTAGEIATHRCHSDKSRKYFSKTSEFYKQLFASLSFIRSISIRSKSKHIDIELITFRRVGLWLLSYETHSFFRKNGIRIPRHSFFLFHFESN